MDKETDIVNKKERKYSNLDAKTRRMCNEIVEEVNYFRDENNIDSLDYTDRTIAIQFALILEIRKLSEKL